MLLVISLMIEQSNIMRYQFVVHCLLIILPFSIRFSAFLIALCFSFGVPSLTLRCSFCSN